MNPTNSQILVSRYPQSWKERRDIHEQTAKGKANIKERGKVRAAVVDNKLIIEPIPSIEDLRPNPVISITVKKAEQLSEEI